METSDPVSGAEPVLFWEKPEEYHPIAIETISAKQLNNWQGWECLAGQNHIHISFEGDIYRGTCHVGGKYGNVFSDPTFPTGNVICNKPKCVCGAEMMIPKFKEPFEDRPHLKLSKKATTLPTDPIAVTGYKSRDPKKARKTVMWNLGRRCNYSCTYCSPDFHSKTEPMRSAQQLQTGIQNVIERFGHGDPLSFYFSGGEPTLFPGFKSSIEYLVSAGHIVSVSSNGSRRKEYYLDLIKLASISFSVHLEFYKKEQFVDMLKYLVHEITKSRVTKEPILNWIDIKVMTAPGRIEEVKSLAEEIVKIPFFHRFAALNFQILWKPDRVNEFYEYTQEELWFFENFNKKETAIRLKKTSRWHYLTLPYLWAASYVLYSRVQKFGERCLVKFWELNDKFPLVGRARFFASHPIEFLKFILARLLKIFWDFYDRTLFIRKPINWLLYNFFHPIEFVKGVSAGILRIPIVKKPFYALTYYVRQPKELGTLFKNFWIPLRNFFVDRMSWHTSFRLKLRTLYLERGTLMRKFRYIFEKPYWFVYKKLHFVRVVYAYLKSKLTGRNPAESHEEL